MAETVIFQHVADLDGAVRAVTAVAIDQQINIIAKLTAHGGDNLFRAAGPFILIAPHLGTGTHLESVKPVAVTKGFQPVSFICRVMSRFIELA